jgi:hypothetical protein
LVSIQINRKMFCQVRFDALSGVAALRHDDEIAEADCDVREAMKNLTLPRA